MKPRTNLVTLALAGMVAAAPLAVYAAGTITPQTQPQPSGQQPTQAQTQTPNASNPSQVAGNAASPSQQDAIIKTVDEAALPCATCVRRGSRSSTA